MRSDRKKQSSAGTDENKQFIIDTSWRLKKIFSCEG